MRAKAFFVMAVALFWSASVFSQSFTIGAFERETSCWKPAPMATISLKAIARDMRWAWRTRLAR